MTSDGFSRRLLAPAIFVSATALLILSINVRLMGIVSRLRQFVHARHDAAKGGRAQEAETYTARSDRSSGAQRRSVAVSFWHWLHSQALSHPACCSVSAFTLKTPPWLR